MRRPCSHRRRVEKLIRVRTVQLYQETASIAMRFSSRLKGRKKNRAVKRNQTHDQLVVPQGFLMSTAGIGVDRRTQDPSASTADTRDGSPQMNTGLDAAGVVEALRGMQSSIDALRKEMQSLRAANPQPE